MSSNATTCLQNISLIYKVAIQFYKLFCLLFSTQRIIREELDQPHLHRRCLRVSGVDFQAPVSPSFSQHTGWMEGGPVLAARKGHIY